MLAALVLGFARVGGAAEALPRNTTITFVANAENQTAPRVRYSGRAWTVDQGGFLVGAGRGHRLLATAAPEAGDFRVELDLALPRAGRESLLVFGPGSELAFASGSWTWKLRGRFFRAGDAPIEVAAPDVKPGKSFNLVIERRGAVVVLSVDGREVVRGACSPGAVSELGLDPDLGVVHLYTLAATGRFGPVTSEAKAFGNPFGMQLRMTRAAEAAGATGCGMPWMMGTSLHGIFVTRSFVRFLVRVVVSIRTRRRRATVRRVARNAERHDDYRKTTAEIRPTLQIPEG